MEKKLIYHYCSFQTFKDIVSNRSLRLNDITKSNDYMELLWIRQYIEEIFPEEFLRETKKNKRFATGYSKKIFDELLNRFCTDYFGKRLRQYTYYAICFSENGDLLSQWRGYANDGKGVAIGLDPAMLSSIGDACDSISDKSVFLSKVIYDEKGQRKAVRGIARKLIRQIRKLANSNSGNIKLKSMVPFNNCFLELFCNAVIMKNPFFKEEEEYRLGFAFYRNSSNTDYIYIGKDYRLGNHTIGSRKNHIDLFFSNGQMIEEVITGPRCKISHSEIRELLNGANMSNCKIRESDGTYRRYR